MSLKGQKRLAASLTGAGIGRIWVDPEEVEKVQSAITRQEIQTLMREGRIRVRRKRGISRGRARALAGRQKGPGRRKGGLGIGKREWVLRVRAVRKHLRFLRDKRQLAPKDYRELAGMSKGGAFRSPKHVDEYVRSKQLLRRR